MKDSSLPVANSQRLLGLDGLRAIAVLLVIAYHCIISSPDLYPIYWLRAVANRLGFGVDIFFVLSGFLITHLLLNEEQKFGRINLLSFYFRRFFRICPPAFAYLLILMLLTSIGFLHISKNDFIYPALFISNYIIPNAEELSHYWSLAVEQQFYIIWPTLLILIKNKRSRLILVSVLIFCSPVWKAIYLYNLDVMEMKNIWRFDMNYGKLLVGCLLALLVSNKRINSQFLSKGIMQHKNILYFSIAGIIFSLSPPIFIHSSILIKSYAELFSWICVAVIINFIIQVSNNTWFNKMINSAVFTWVGQVSYSLYIWQQLFCWLGETSQDSLIKSIPINIFLSFGCAALSFYFIEKPFLRIRNILQKKWFPIKTFLNN
jgi:peptidoglycan/LPS O-acetylase OafA/YrhL